MIYNSDVIVYLYPSEGKAKNRALATIHKPQNASRFIPARHRCNSASPQSYDTSSCQVRDSTVPPEEHDDLQTSPCIAVRFSDGASSPFGVMMGRNPNAGVVLPKIPGVSWHHCALSFNKDNRLIVRDTGSLCGTRVVYDGENTERGYNVEWVVYGHSFLEDKTPTVVITGLLQFKLVVPPHDITCQQYLDNVANFRQQMADLENTFANFTLIHPKTEPPTAGEITPASHSCRTILYKKEIGKGSYGVVTHIWSSATAEEYALKEPLTKLRASGQVDIEAWKGEAMMMKRISHPHIVKFLGAEYSPWPQLSFEYLPKGSLDRHQDLSIFEKVQVLRQLLSAVKYLQGLKTPVGHRDIKPENILVLSREAGIIVVKFADFGLAKQAEYLETACGTLWWAAPEIYAKMQRGEAEKYTAAADIWSLGLVIAERECGLPKWRESHRHGGTAWADTVLKHIQSHPKRDSKLSSLLLETMLVIDPQERKSAAYCYEKVQEFEEELKLSGCSFECLSDDWHEELTTSVEDEGESEKFTIRLYPRDDSRTSHGSETIARPIITSANIPDLIADLGECGSDLINSPSNSNDDETLGSSDTSTSSTQLWQNSDKSIAISAGTIVSGELWNLEQTTSLSHERDAATEDGRGHQNEPRSKGLANLSFLIRNYVGGAMPNDTDQVRMPAASEEPRMIRKRTRVGNDGSVLMAPSADNQTIEDVVLEQCTTIQGASSGQNDRDSKRTRTFRE